MGDRSEINFSEKKIQSTVKNLLLFIYFYFSFLRPHCLQGTRYVCISNNVNSWMAPGSPDGLEWVPKKKTRQIKINYSGSRDNFGVVNGSSFSSPLGSFVGLLLFSSEMSCSLCFPRWFQWLPVVSVRTGGRRVKNPGQMTWVRYPSRSDPTRP